MPECRAPLVETAPLGVDAPENEISIGHHRIERTLADELLEPCVIYARDVLGLARSGLIRSAAHITGGGFHENIPRALPAGLGAELARGSWAEHPVFRLVQRASGATDDEMFSTFNMGIGMVLVVAPEDVDEVLERGAPGAGAAVSRIGVVTPGAGVRVG